MLNYLTSLSNDPESRIDHRLHNEIGASEVLKYAVSQKKMPSYRYVDVYRATLQIAGARPNLRTLDSEVNETLSSLLHTAKAKWASREINRSSTTAWTVAPDTEEFLPVDQFWIFDASESDKSAIIIRLTYNTYEEQATLEVATKKTAESASLITEISDLSISKSIYREQMFALSFESGTKDEYGDIEKPERLRINFRVAAEVSEKDFVVDEDAFSTLKRNIIDLHVNRERLREVGVPIRRGVLLYGPPGTGKTYACRYICGCLKNTTRIVVAGTALNMVSQIFDLARLYQPSIVFLEDVDLVFTARDINLYSSALGDLLDQMDGLRPFEDVGIVLTTNSIDRIEAAIKDRPGRISQCIYFGAPERELRLKYIQQYSKKYDCKKADFDQLLRLSDGATPAFIKEWVHRSVQFASERINASEEFHLVTEDFELAYKEMRRGSDSGSGSIIGFIGS